MSGDLTIVPRHPGVIFRSKTQDYFAGRGWYEVYNYSFSNEAKDESVLIMDHSSAVRIQNAVSEEYTIMRRSLAPLLLSNVRENLKISSSFSFFEIAQTHSKQADNIFMEQRMVAGVSV